MIGKPSAKGTFGMLLLIVGALSGCRSFPMPKPFVGDVAVEREERMAVVVEQFEQRRNFAELKAAQGARDRGDLGASRTALENLLRRSPRNREARLLLATVHLEQGDQLEAQAQLQTALIDWPDDSEVHQAMGNLLKQMGQPDEAWAHFDRAEKLAARQEATLAGVEPPVQAAGPADGASNVCPVVPAAGSTELSDNGRAGAAVGAAGGGGARVAALLHEGEDALARGDDARARALFGQAIGLEPNNPHIPTSVAVAALRQDCPEMAIIIADEALAVFPRCVGLLRTLGAAHYRVGDFQSSQLVLQQALSLDKSDWLAYFLLGCTHLGQKRYEAAESCFAEARRINPHLAADAMSGVR